MAYLCCLSWFLVVAYFCEVNTDNTLNDHLELKSSCVCPGDTVTFAECTTVGRSGYTIWTGTAFNCASNNIVLSHTFNTSAGECNSRSIVGRGVRVVDNQYTSQINITVSPDLIGKTIQCFHENFDTQNITEVGTLTISKSGPFPPPTTLFISQADFVLRQIIFNWSEVVTDCSIHYRIQAINCGSCPITTSHTTVTCTDIPTDGTTCEFAVKTISCGDTESLGDTIYHLSLTFPFTPDIPRIKRDSLSILIAGVVLLVVTVSSIIGLFLVWVCKKRLSSVKSSLQNVSSMQTRSQVCNSNQGEDMYGYSMQNATIKTFDNEKMGTYGLDDYTHKNSTTTITKMDHPPDLSSLLHMLKGQAISSRWYHFGLELGVPKKTLDQLTDYSEEDSLVEVLDYWLKHHQQPTWKEIANAQNKICFSDCDGKECKLD